MGLAPHRWNGGERGPARPGPHFLGRNGGKNPRGRRFLPRDPLLWWGCVGEAVLLTGYLACGPHIERPVTARPPAGRAGDVGEYPLGEGREEPFGFPLSPPVNKPLLPPARAGGRAMRRWSLRPQARPLPDGTTFPHSSHQRMGFQGEGTSFPLVFFPLFLQRNRAPPGRAPFPAVPTAPGTPQWLPPPKPGAGPCLPPTTNGLPHILRQAVREIGKVKHWAALPGYRSVLLWPDPR